MNVDLELLALRWLRWEKRCVIVIMERSPREYLCGQPDVLGVTRDRYLYEIEVKRSLSDFRADSDKPSRRNRGREHYAQFYPKQFYYLVPNSLVHKVNGELPEWSGLMSGPGPKEVQTVRVVKTAPIWKPSKRLTVKECSVLVFKMANQILSLAETNHILRNKMADDDQCWRREFDPAYNNFQI